MILNSSGTAECNQILKQMMYRGRKLKKRENLGEGERGKKKEKKKYGGAGALQPSLFIIKKFINTFKAIFNKYFLKTNQCYIVI